MKGNVLSDWGKGLLCLFLALSPLATPLRAQSVSVSPATGNLLNAKTYSTEAGAPRGWSSMWLHDQIGLVLQVADGGTLTPGGGIEEPAGNISLYGGQYVIMGGQRHDCYVAVSLPVGFRFTGYRMVVQNNLNGTTVNSMAIARVSKTLYETDHTFGIADYYAKTAELGSTNSDDEVVLARTSRDGGADMGSHLYFLIARGGDAYYGLTLKSLVVYYTTEGGTEVHVAPLRTDAEYRNHSISPFAVGKPDVGALTPHSTSVGTVYAYDHENYKSLMANNLIYTHDAVGADGKVDLAGQTGSKTITSAYNSGAYRWGLGNNTYYVETPVEATSQTGNHYATNYRITSARVNYLLGESVGESDDDTRGSITYTTSDGTVYYLDKFGKFTLDAAEAEEWRNDGQGICGQDGQYLVASRRQLAVAASYSSSDTHLKNDDSGNIYYTTGVIFRQTYYLHGNTDGSVPAFSTSTSGRAHRVGVHVAAFTPQPYTLTVYDKTGQNVVQTVQVSADNAEGSVLIEGLNNDAVKLQVSGLPEGGRALITVDLTLEALNPYVNRFKMVCHDPTDGRQLAQVYSAEEFSVRGGKFKFYVPADFLQSGQDRLSFTLEDLYHLYGDDTYYDHAGTGRARYSFVGSTYYGSDKTRVANLYDASPDEPYTSKVVTEYCGDQPFKFNNVADLGQTSSGGQTSYLEEYRFSLADYAGSFAPLTTAGSGSLTRYVFTADETRYNIAPTRGTEHRAHAAYTLDFEVETRSYEPAHTWTRVYERTCHGQDGQDVTRPQWGLTLATSVPEGEAQGYLTVDQVNSILDRMAASAADGGTGDAQATLADILYVDASRLSTLVYDKAAEGQASALELMRRRLGANALVYLPHAITIAADNFATQTAEGNFRAANDIVLTDGKPFYAPYAIQVSASNRATYSRKVNWAQGDDHTKCTLILPFALSVDGEGIHRGQAGEGSIQLCQMNATDCLQIPDDEAGIPTDYFSHLQTRTLAGASEANTPYMVLVTEQPADTEAAFRVSQTGATVSATATGMDANAYTYTGETGQGTIGGQSRSFTSRGSFAGSRLEKAMSHFYFAGGMLLNTRNLRPGLDYLYVYPFRAYYECPEGASAKELPRMNIGFGDNPQAGTTGIQAATGQATDLAIVPGHGTLTLQSQTGRRVTVCTPAGTTVARLALRAGETRTLALATGVYLVENHKTVVR